MKKSDKLLSALFTVVLGILFIILKGDVVSIGMTVVGIWLIINSVIHFINKDYNLGIIKLVLGIVVIIFGWTLISAALYILSAVLLISSVMQILTISKYSKGFNVNYVNPIISIIVAICLLFNQGGTISWVFIVCGVFLIIEGLVALFDSSKH